MSKIYYGTEKLPPGHRNATMLEAAKAGQVRRFGLFLIDPILLSSKITTVGPKEGDYKDKFTRAKGKVHGILHRYKLANSPETKKRLKLEYDEAIIQLKKAQSEYEAFKKNPIKQKLVAIPDPKKQPGYHKKRAQLKKKREKEKLKKLEAKKRREMKKKKAPVRRKAPIKRK